LVFKPLDFAWLSRLLCIIPIFNSVIYPFMQPPMRWIEFIQIVVLGSSHLASKSKSSHDAGLPVLGSLWMLDQCMCIWLWMVNSRRFPKAPSERAQRCYWDR
jgi:hypothetical protein